MLAQFAVGRLRDRMHRRDRLLQTENFYWEKKDFNIVRQNKILIDIIRM